MNVLWFSWKDSNHPAAGGAELVSSQLMESLVRGGHNIKLITSGYRQASARSTVNGVIIYRVGGRHSVYWRAYRLYKKQLRDWPDLIIDEMNTVPFGCGFYVKQPCVLLTYQLARKVWFYQLTFPLSLIGYWLESAYLRIMSHRYKLVLTESQSTRQDLTRFGFDPQKVKVFRVSMELEPLPKLPPKTSLDTVLVLGAMRPMKQTLDAVKAFEYARDTSPKLKLVLAGDNGGKYGQKVMRYISRSRHTNAINVMGRVDGETRLKVMRQAAVILVTSVKEGWGLIVTEAGSQGTPAVVYDADGLRDSVTHQKTGLVSQYGSPKEMATAINRLLKDPVLYQRMRQEAYESSKQYTLKTSYQDFSSTLKTINIQL